MSTTDEQLQRAYAPPLSGASPPRSLGTLSQKGPSWRRASFEVGFRERHTVSLEVNVFTGRESYAVDGVEVLSTHSFWGPREFFVGTNEQHRVRFHVAWHGRISATVDGEKRHDNLLPGLHFVFCGAMALLVIFLLSLIVPEMPNVPRSRSNPTNRSARPAVKMLDVAPPNAGRRVIAPPHQNQAPRRVR